MAWDKVTLTDIVELTIKHPLMKSQMLGNTIWGGALQAPSKTYGSIRVLPARDMDSRTGLVPLRPYLSTADALAVIDAEYAEEARLEARDAALGRAIGRMG